MGRLRLGSGLAAAVALVALTGCSNPGAQDASAVALDFLRAEPARACELLAPATAQAVAAEADGDCAAALGELELAAGGAIQAVEMAGEGAQVRLADDVLFLAHFPEGWRVRAAGCVREQPDPAVPYTCVVEP